MNKLPEARIERERYVLAVFAGARAYYNTLLWERVADLKNATKFPTQQDALKGIQAYGQKFHGDINTRDSEVWLITESKTATLDWVVDSERQIV